MKPVRRRKKVDHLRAVWQVSARCACKAIPINRSSYCYRSKRTGQAQLTTRIREIAETRVRHGHRRIHVLLRREGLVRERNATGAAKIIFEVDQPICEVQTPMNATTLLHRLARDC